MKKDNTRKRGDRGALGFHASFLAFHAFFSLFSRGLSLHTHTHTHTPSGRYARTRIENDRLCGVTSPVSVCQLVYVCVHVCICKLGRVLGVYFLVLMVPVGRGPVPINGTLHAARDGGVGHSFACPLLVVYPEFEKYGDGHASNRAWGCMTAHLSTGKKEEGWVVSTAAECQKR